jgi:4-hydroxy-3-methylbut-2-enyl diphosphate reductase
VQDCVGWLQNKYQASVEERSIREEEVYFPLPKELRVIRSKESADNF